MTDTRTITPDGQPLDIAGDGRLFWPTVMPDPPFTRGERVLMSISDPFATQWPAEIRSIFTPEGTNTGAPVAVCVRNDLWQEPDTTAACALQEHRFGQHGLWLKDEQQYEDGCPADPADHAH